MCTLGVDPLPQKNSYFSPVGKDIKNMRQRLLAICLLFATTKFDINISHTLGVMEVEKLFLKNKIFDFHRLSCDNTSNMCLLDKTVKKYIQYPLIWYIICLYSLGRTWGKCDF